MATKTRPPFKPSISEISDGLFIADSDTAAHIPTVQQHGITSVVSMTDGPYALWERARYRVLVPQERHLFVACLDTSTQDLLVHMPKICDFMDQQLSMDPIPKPSIPRLSSESPSEISEKDVDKNIPPRLLIHCQMGISRSATAVIAYLMRKHQKPMEHVLHDVQEKRKIRPNPNFLEQLRVWEAVHYEIWEDDEHAVPKEAYRVYLEGRSERLKAKGLTGDEPTWPIF